VMTGRLGRIVDRARALHELGKTPDALDTNQRLELGIIPRRIKLIKRAILMSVASALAICLVIALLFVSSLIDLPIGIAVAFVFIASMALMMGGLIALLKEVELALRLFYVYADVSPITEASGS
jgi:hypothetical protein